MALLSNRVSRCKYLKESILINDLKMEEPWGKMTRHNGIGAQGVDMTDKII
jgi:hypothetical protein